MTKRRLMHQLKSTGEPPKQDIAFLGCELIGKYFQVSKIQALLDFDTD
jgi:hypothetical protein